MNRINIDVTATDQIQGEQIARLITANLNTHGFEDVTNTSGPAHNDKEEEVVEAMRNLNPEIFAAEVAIDVSTFADAADVDVIGSVTSDDEFGVTETGVDDDDGDATDRDE